MASLTPDMRKVGMGTILPSPTPFLTPRPERRRIESRCSDWSLNREREVNVQVLLRCRPLSDEEQRANVARVISCNEGKREVTVLQSVANKQVDRVFSFDKVFGPKAQQRSIYDQAIAPIVNEVLDGFNCTVFAYGQTGTGKTYTMEGGMRNKGGDLPAEAGVIPRAVRQIFDILESQNADYTMKVTFLELYNEEITDLLAPDDGSRVTEDKQRKPISLMEDGKGCVVVRGLEEETVYTANEIYAVLERGAAKRRTADTLLNKRSSRSHSVFSITVLVKEAAVGDEDLIKCGKLNLVDLAGSENISRSGAREGRAREAGEINKSLLTLGRVINALVEHSTHVPYRDSKLTRLLRDSLGGKTKTCIIATVSPSAHCLEETLSTLDYAYRAKNIKNKPEANQKMSKAVLLKDLYLEIEKMKEDVRAAREKNGVYVPHERYALDEAEKKARIGKIEQLENDLSHSEKEVDKFRELYLTEQAEKLDVESNLKNCEVSLEKRNKEFLDLQDKHKLAVSTLKEKEFVISKLLHSENTLIKRAKELRSDLQTASEDISSLFARLDHKDKMESENHSMVLTFGSHLDQSLKALHRTVLGSVSQQQQQLRCMEEHAQLFLARKCDSTKALESRINKITETYTSGVTTLKELASRMQNVASSDLEKINEAFVSQVTAVDHFLATAVLEAKDVIEDIENSLVEQKQLLAFSKEQQEKGLQQSLISAQVISKATVDFFNDIHHQASKVVEILEEGQIKRSDQLLNFEKMFKEEAVKEEKQAMEKIAQIIAVLTSKKTAMVSEATSNFQDSTIKENKRVLHEMSNIQKISCDAKVEMGKYAETVQKHFMEDTFLLAESAAVIENCLDECSQRVVRSGQQWQTSQSSIGDMHKRSVLAIEFSVKDKISRSTAAHEEYLSSTATMDTNFDARTRDLMASVNDSLMQDHENKREINSMTTLCLDQLKSIQQNHGQSISNIRNHAENRLTRDYLIDQNTTSTPQRRAISIPSAESIEEMRTSMNEEIKENLENKSKWSNKDCKTPQHLVQVTSQNRAPFCDVN